MNRNILLAIAGIFGVFFLINTVDAANVLERRIATNPILQKSNQGISLIRDQVRCTCGGEVCSGYFGSQSGVSIGELIIYCAQTCACKTSVGFEYQTAS